MPNFPRCRRGPQGHAAASRKLYFGCTGLALLGVAGTAAKAVHFGSAVLSSATVGGTIQEAQTWEELPGIDKVIRKAQSLKDRPLHDRQELFYDSVPEELAWIMSTVRSVLATSQF